MLCRDCAVACDSNTAALVQKPAVAVARRWDRVGHSRCVTARATDLGRIFDERPELRRDMLCKLFMQVGNRPAARQKAEVPQLAH
jgi:hypothetical protein